MPDLVAADRLLVAVNVEDRVDRWSREGGTVDKFQALTMEMETGGAA